jgi:hypothetical protein
MIAVETIQFNHDPGTATHDALNIRRNATQTVVLPEWRRFACVNPEDSPAAYSVMSTKGNAITIQASFRCSDPAIHSAELRVPHHVHTKTVSFAGGASGVVTFDLIDPPVTHGHVGVWDVDWHWEYRLPHDFHWHPMHTTRHRIYVVLDMPTAPWSQLPFTSANVQLPWTEALDHACDWARGANSKDRVARMITENVYALGPAVVTYDCPGGGASHYSFSGFDCSAFLDRLRGGAGNGIYVNCSDCATILSTFANLLGCDLWQSRMGYSFGLNPILAIGSNIWQTACGWGGFFYHEVAWADACTATDDVWDGCLELNGSPNPTGPPFLPLLPCDLEFGNEYVNRLASPAGIANCQPRPTTRQRRAVS